MFSNLKRLFITSKEKAIAGFLAGAVGSYLVQSGLTIKDIWSVHALQALAVGVITHILVYSTTNTKG